jgi:hypothetical protein
MFPAMPRAVRETTNRRKVGATQINYANNPAISIITEMMIGTIMNVEFSFCDNISTATVITTVTIAAAIATTINANTSYPTKDNSRKNVNGSAVLKK